MYILDTREQTNDHIKRYFDKHGIPYTVRKLDCGDYAMEERPGIAIERKKSLDELAHNLLSRDRARFYREVRRARDAGITLIVLCEHGPDVKCLNDVKGWKSKYGKVTGKVLADAIFRLEIGYGVETRFCGKRSTGKMIVELLEGWHGDEDILRRS